MLRIRAIVLGAAALALAPTIAAAQPLSAPLNFSVRNISFELWCQETQRYPEERCKARGSADLQAFLDYRSAIERYEIDHLKQIQREAQIRQRTNRDPTSTVANKFDGFR